MWELHETKGNKGGNLTYFGTNARTNAPPTYLPPLAAVQPYNFFSHKLVLDVPLYTGGRLENAIDAQKHGVQAAERGLEANKQQIQLEATVAFYQVLEAKDLSEVARESVNSLTIHLHNVEQQYDAGVVAKADVLRSKVQVANVQNNLIQAENNYEMSVYQLNHVMGLPLRGELELRAALEDVPYPLSMDESINYALQHRPELEQAQAQVAIAEDQVKIAKGEKRPSVSFVGTNVWDDTDYPGIDYKHWAVSLNAQWNLFDSGVVNAKIAKANHATTAAKERARDVEDNIGLEVSQAYLNIIEAKKRIDTSNVAVEEAETDFMVAQKRYSNGIGINLDVIDAELALNTAKTNYIRALYDYNVSRAKLDKAIGLHAGKA